MKVKDILQNCSEWIPGGGYNDKSPIVSVLLPTFRRAKSGLFEKAVRSVLEQDLKNIELIIIDDASTDGTAQLIDSFMKDDPRVSCIRHKYNIGLPAISEYEGVVKARGEYIAFIFDDNEWEKDYLDRTVDFMKCNRAKAAYGRMFSYYGKGVNECIELGIATLKVGPQSLDAMNYIANGAVVLSKEVLYDKRVGLYDPHVAVTRLCDWGLWKRLIRYYKFFETGILAGKELGVTQSDSLGNTYKMNLWGAGEREQEVMLGELVPENFPEIEINRISEKSTDFYQNTVRDFYQSFSDKKWYREETCKVDKKKPRFRILVLASDYTATLYLSFLRLLYLGKDFVFSFGDENTTPDRVALADAVILVRDLVALERYEIFCKKLNIPYYYYTDDNFIELHKDYKEDAHFKAMNEILKSSRINQFSGVFTATPCLTDYFIENKLHSNVMTLEPSIDLENISKPKTKQNKDFTIAFMGGGFRKETLGQVVMPALEKLSGKYSIRLIYPEEMDLELSINKNIEFIGIKRERSLDLALKYYAHYEPDILIHCGPDIRNNVYKNANALINAVQLGAVLVTSDFLPYNVEELKNKIYYCVGNNSLEWEATLDDLLSDAQLRENMYTRAKEYCIQRYSYQKGEKILHKALIGLKPLSEYETICRLNSTIYDLIYGHTAETSETSETAETSETPEEKPSRSLVEAPLRFIGGIKKYKKYFICCQCDVFTELGICFASLGKAMGNVRIGIWSEEEQLRECILSLEEYIHDNWTYVSFEPIQNARDQVYTISLDFEYEENSALVGVFVDAAKNTFIVKVANRLGFPLRIVDYLYVDCR